MFKDQIRGVRPIYLEAIKSCEHDVGKDGALPGPFFPSESMLGGYPATWYLSRTNARLFCLTCRRPRDLLHFEIVSFVVMAPKGRPCIDGSFGQLSQKEHGEGFSELIAFRVLLPFTSIC